MLLLFPQGTTGTTSIGVSDFTYIQVIEGTIGDYAVDTLDNLFLSISESVLIAPGVSPSDTCNITLSESASLLVSGTTPKGASDDTSLTLTEAATVAATVGVTDTASLTLSESSTVDIGQIAVDVTDDIILTLDDAAFSSGVPDFDRNTGEDFNLHVEDSASVTVILPCAAIKFYLQTYSITFGMRLLS